SVAAGVRLVGGPSGCGAQTPAAAGGRGTDRTGCGDRPPRASRGPAVSTARTWAVALTGVDGHMVEVEADFSTQTPEFKIIGLPDKALGEAVQRVWNACSNAGLDVPRRRLTVNLSPASLPKHGSGFDLSIAVATVAAGGALPPEGIRSTVHIGELGLDGRLRPVPGVLPAVYARSEEHTSELQSRENLV